MKDFDRHIEQTTPTPDPSARRKAIALAREKFEQEAAQQQHSQSSEKNSQGLFSRLRLMATNTLGRVAMIIENRTLLGGVASAGLLLVGVALVLPTFLNRDVANEPVMLEDIAMEEAVIYTEPQAIEVRYAAEKDVAALVMDAAPAPVSSPPVLGKRLERKVNPARLSLADSMSYELHHGKKLENRDEFEEIKHNNVKLTQEQPVSTFSIDVDTASYSFVRRSLNEGRLPPADAVRAEEMINYFDYRYPSAESTEQPFRPLIHVVDSPWAPGKKLVHVGIKGYEPSAIINKRTNLVFLLDVSGSMNEPDKLPLLVQSMELLVEQLSPEDTLSIVVYAGAAGTVLEPTAIKDKTKILNALRQLRAGGSTAGAEGIELAYQLAEQNFDKEAVNRIILATDGDFNVGINDTEQLKSFVKRKRETGVYLSVLGFGSGNYNDHLMQTLAQNGNGIAAYIDSLNEARKVLVDQANSSLFPIANDVKIQIEFNPAQVKEYRLIGYETRLLDRADFNNDKVDAGDIGAGHSVTALYEIVPTGSDLATIDPLRYGVQDEQAAGNKTKEFGFFKLRYKLPEQSESRKITASIIENSIAPSLRQEIDFSIAVAAFAQYLSGGEYIGQYSLDDIIALAQANKGSDPFGYRTEFVQLVRAAKLAKDI
ncbi:VWA domain-containing protein [Gilvimarinus sp. SDUM040013]|uniref:VWA domain-containing protein n=1 Tax=Gilvimarinus gilvus TaxID=3058038 RepID=A0ABU4S0W0_9GAMM|nr:VWA domain-containing protein [Gilvimarinus sp. SDUM040013]MDO3384905.1 VWA domain-containing protein [Gilvimarinus sp. SDUM040013]MDX6850670.1 VWA domain-containing protein [Gilvimarinus sp. SDUM040013]